MLFSILLISISEFDHFLPSVLGYDFFPLLYNFVCVVNLQVRKFSLFQCRQLVLWVCFSEPPSLFQYFLFSFYLDDLSVRNYATLFSTTISVSELIHELDCRSVSFMSLGVLVFGPWYEELQCPLGGIVLWWVCSILSCFFWFVVLWNVSCQILKWLYWLASFDHLLEICFFIFLPWDDVYSWS